MTDESTDTPEQEMILEVACNVSDTLEEAVSLSEEDLLRVALLTLERVRLAESVEVSLLITDDAGLQELNREFRGRDEPTDVLSFPLQLAPLVDAPADQLWEPQAAAESWPTGEVGDAPGEVNPVDATDLATDLATDEDDDLSDIADDEDADAILDDAPLHLGDIAISRDAVARQAAAAGHSVPWECAYLFAHGLLHLMGYDDSTDAGYQAMVAHQEAVLTEAGISR